MMFDVIADNDESCSGELFLFNPSSTTFVKHFIARSNGMKHGAFMPNTFGAGYCNTTTAIDAIQFNGIRKFRFWYIKTLWNKGFIMSIVKFNDRGVKDISTFGSVGTGELVFIKKLTASSVLI